MLSFSSNFRVAPEVSFPLLLLIAILGDGSEAFSTLVDRPPQNSIIFPIKSPTSSSTTIVGGGDEDEASSETAIGNSLSSAFDKLVGTSKFLVPSSSNDNDQSSSGHRLSSCRVPVFGDQATVTFSPRPSAGDDNDGSNSNPITEYELFAFDFDYPIEDFGQLCLELYKYRADLQNVVGIDGLEQNALNYLNCRPPDPGMDAELTSSEAIGDEKFGTLLDSMIDEESLVKLQQNGFVTIDNVMKTSQSSNDKVGTWSDKKKSSQGHCRTDTVAHLDRNNALECGLEEQYDFLMTLASHLNDNLDFDACGYETPYAPILPGTKDRPLTNPSERKNVQIAEYGCGDYYMAHSDNSIDVSGRDLGPFEGISMEVQDDTATLPKRRSNWRCITAILYLNEGWNKSDGGQLRMYLDSSFVERPESVEDDELDAPYIDINPSNGKLLLFDSRMIHSVEKVVSESKIRRALTLWIRMPEKSGVTGAETFHLDNDE